MISYVDKMHISNTKFRIAPLTKDLLEISAKVLAETFASGNDIWSTMKNSRQELHLFMFRKLRQILECEEKARKQGIIQEDTYINFVYLDEKDQIVAVWTNIELSQYLRTKSQVSLPLFEKLETCGHQMEKSLSTIKVAPGKQISGLWGAVRKQERQNKVAVYLMLDVAHMLASQGFHTLFCRCSSTKVKNGLLRDGGQILSQLPLALNGKQHPLYYIKWKLKSMFDRKIEMQQSQIKAKF